MPPPGPATPVMATASSLPVSLPTPAAISVAHSADTAPCAVSVASVTPSSSIFAALL